MKIIKYEEKYRDDMIFMVLEAKNALGRVPRLNEDLLDIEKNYINRGDMFFIALDRNARVIGCVGYSSIENTTQIWLHRFYVKANLKHPGIGTKLLETVENYAKVQGKTAIYVHLGKPRERYFESYNFYPKNGFKVYSDKPDYMKKAI